MQSKREKAQARKDKLLARGAGRLRIITGEARPCSSDAEYADATDSSTRSRRRRSAEEVQVTKEDHDNQQCTPDAFPTAADSIAPTSCDDGESDQSRPAEEPTGPGVDKVQRRWEKWGSYQQTGNSAQAAADAPSLKMSSLSNTQVLTIVAWEVADLKIFLSVLYAFACHACHGSQAPQSLGLAWVCWCAVNSSPPLVVLTLLLATLLAANTLYLKQRGALTEMQSLQLQQDEPSWTITLARKVLGLIVGESYIGHFSAVHLIVGEVVDCWAVFLVTIVLSNFFLIPAAGLAE